MKLIRLPSDAELKICAGETPTLSIYGRQVIFTLLAEYLGRDFTAYDISIMLKNAYKECVQQSETLMQEYVAFLLENDADIVTLLVPNAEDRAEVQRLRKL